MNGSIIRIIIIKYTRLQPSRGESVIRELDVVDSSYLHDEVKEYETLHRVIVDTRE